MWHATKFETRWKFLCSFSLFAAVSAAAAAAATAATAATMVRYVRQSVDLASYTKNNLLKRVTLQRDENDTHARTRGFGLCLMGGKIDESDGKLYAYVSWMVPNGSASKAGLKLNDKIIEWDGKSLINCSYEQVASIVDASPDSIEILYEPAESAETYVLADR